MALLREPMVSLSTMAGLPKIVWRAALVVLVALGLAFYFLRGGNGATHYVTAKVTRGSIVRSVIATGTVNPVVTVQVGSYVSGPIQAIYADFNAPVKANQLIAKIDPRPFQVKVAQSQATPSRAIHSTAPIRLTCRPSHKSPSIRPISSNSRPIWMRPRSTSHTPISYAGFCLKRKHAM